jgi:hypothetical protein
MSSTRKFRRSGPVRPGRTGFKAAVEAFEKRELLTAAPFIQGTAFVDPVGTGNLTGSDAVLPGATVNLYQGTTVSNANLVATTTTDASGNYLIVSQTKGTGAGSALTPGVYTLVETPPTGYTNTATGGFSEIDPYSVVNSSSIQVTVESNALTTTYLNNTSPNLAASYTLQSGSTIYTCPGGSITPADYSTALVGSSTALDASFPSYCVDAGHELDYPPESYGTTTDPQSSLPNGGEIAYLFNQYGNPNATASSFPTSATSLSTDLGELDAGLQVAIWDLEYNNGAATGNFNLTGTYPGTSTAQLNTAQSIATALVANAVAANAAGKSEQVAVLDASSDGNPSGLTDPHSQANTQSILAGESFNFGNIQTSIKGTDYLVSNKTTASSLTPSSSSSYTVANTSIALVNTTTGATVATTTTDSSGQYSFTGIPLGTYSVIETTPTGGYTHVGQTSTTSGASSTTTTTSTTITPITLTTSNLTSTDNFFETASVSVTGTDYLVGATTNLTTSTTGTALAGTSITLTGTDEFGNAINLTTTTNASGQYSFLGLNPTTATSGYTVAENSTPGYTHLGQTTTTIGAIAVSTTIPSSSLLSVTSIALTTNGTSSVDNFFEIGSSISGTVYIDASGEGLTAGTNLPAANGDTVEPGVPVSLYNSSGTTPIATTITGPDGTFSFGGLLLGTYKVTETVLPGYTQTGPASLIYVVTTTAAVPNSINDNFSNYMSSCSAGGMSNLTNVTYTITTPSGVSKTVTNLRGNTAAGDTVTANFTVTGTYSDQLSLVAYEAPTSSYSPSNAYQQVIVGLSEGTFPPGGPYHETVTLPNSFYQVDFVCGAPLTQLELNGAPTDYNYENRLISADNGGTTAYTTSSLAGIAYVDKNGNGTYGTGDTLLPNVTVTLTGTTYVGATLTGTTLSPVAITPIITTTNSSGAYSFANLAPGSYTVTESTPSGYVSEIANVGSVGGTAVLGSVSSVALNSNVAATSYNFGQYLPVTISGTEYVDNNGNNSFGSGDTGLGGVTVYLYSGTTQLATTVTASSGNSTGAAIGSYSFGNLAPGSYIVAEFPPSGYTGETPNVGVSGGTSSYTASSTLDLITTASLTSGTNDTGNNFGLYQPGTISGLAYVDATNSGSYVSGDTAISGVTINLVNSSATIVATTKTGSGGTYSFSGVVPGTYKVTETGVPSGYLPDKTNTGSLSVVVTSGSTSANNNFGEVNSTSISGIKYADSTGNGLSSTQSPLTGDTPLGGVTIDLFTASPYTLIASTVTAADGSYSFTGLPYGTYDVAEVVPTGQIQTGPTVFTGPTSTPSIGDCNFNTICVGSGSNAYVYNPSGDCWTFSGQSGLSGNGSGFTYCNPNAPVGNQVAFLQNQGCFSQIVSGCTSGEYQLSFSAAERANYGLQNFNILVDGNIVATCQPSSTSYQTFTTPSFYVGSGSHTITFQGLDSCGTDSTDFLDNVCMTQHTGQVVAPGNGQAYYSVSLTSASPTSTNDNFSDYSAPTTGSNNNPAALSSISYKVSSTTSNWWGGCSTTTNTYSNLSGNTNPGNTVSATFTVTGNVDQMVTLVSYIVPYSGAPLSAQTVYSLDTGEFTPGTHTVTVTLPTSSYQVDFVSGAAITAFGSTTSNVSYHGENRFISSDSDGCGTTCYVTPPLANVQSDIGSVITPGTESYNNGSYSITASGSDFWGSADSGNYVYQTLNGNGEIVAQVASISNTDPWTKAGVMIRQSLDPGSPQASVFSTPGNGVVFQDRETQGGQSNSWSASNSYGANSNTAVFVKIVRDGNTLTGYDSSNGVNWTEVGTDTINMSQSVYIGLAVTAHNNSAVATATFNDVSTTGYWASSAGQSLIGSFGGWSGSTCLSTWLAQNYGNLYGSNAGCDNLWGQNNSSVAAFCQSIEAQYGCESLEFQTLSTAIDEYATNWGLGGSIACNWGFSGSGNIASTYENTSGSCSAFGTSSSNPWATVGSLLSFENSQASCGTLYIGNSNNHQLACNVIYQVGGCF